MRFKMVFSGPHMFVAIQHTPWLQEEKLDAARMRSRDHCRCMLKIRAARVCMPRYGPMLGRIVVNPDACDRVRFHFRVQSAV